MILILYIKRSDKNTVMSFILACMLLFPLITLPSPTTQTTIMANYAYAQISSNDDEDSYYSITVISDGDSPGVIKKNATLTRNQDNNTNKMTEFESTSNNAIVSSKSQFKNETGFSSNTTTADITSGNNDAALAATGVTGDFNGDGFDDKAIGASGEEFGSSNTTGAVHVIYGSSGGLSATAVIADQMWTQDSAGIEGIAEDWDYFGVTISSGDYNGDGFDDLSIGVYGEDIDLAVASIENFDVSINSAVIAKDTGVVQVIYGSPAGLSATAVLPDQVWIQGFADIADFSENYDGFGTRLSSGDYNGDGHDDLAIGAQYEETGSLDNTGGVHIIYGSSGGLSATAVIADQRWTQDSTDIEDAVEASDEFGSSLSSGDYNGDGSDDLAIGAAQETIGTSFGTGAVNVIYGSSGGLSATAVIADQMWTQNSTDIDGVAETKEYFSNSLSSGDYNGDGRDDLAVGTPAEDVGTVIDAGAVNVIYGSSGGLSATAVIADQLLTQDSPGIDGVAEADDRIGVPLSSADYNGDGRDDLAIAATLEDVGTVIDAGAVHVIYGSSGGLSATAVIADQMWTQNSTDIEDVVERIDWFGDSLSSADYNGDGRDDLAIAATLEDVGTVIDAGAVNVIYGSSGGLSATAVIADQLWTQDSPDIEDVAEFLDYFGASL
jgi:FG-GAP repeat protein